MQICKSPPPPHLYNATKTLNNTEANTQHMCSVSSVIMQCFTNYRFLTASPPLPTSRTRSKWIHNAQCYASFKPQSKTKGTVFCCVQNLHVHNELCPPHNLSDINMITTIKIMIVWLRIDIVHIFWLALELQAMTYEWLKSKFEAERQ